MSEFITLMTFNFPHETGVPRSLLESEGIPTYLLNDHTSQTISLYNIATGGIQLQVSARDAEKAIQVLTEHGIIKAHVVKESEWLKKIDRVTKALPWIGSMKFVYRLFLLLALIITFLTLVLFFMVN